MYDLQSGVATSKEPMLRDSIANLISSLLRVGFFDPVEIVAVVVLLLLFLVLPNSFS